MLLAFLGMLFFLGKILLPPCSNPPLHRRICSCLGRLCPPPKMLPTFLVDAGVFISMDGKGQWMDDVFIERLWRSLKWECFNLREFETGSQTRQALGNWFHFYNEQRPHTAFDGRHPMDVYRDGHSASRGHEYQPD